ncbi:hypothetical protein [Streptomyces werraensis]|uniref:hypothetical protein n=1 Tax=Streptomyces werraensis TaxID=68284 RepID=UPI0037D71D6B
MGRPSAPSRAPSAPFVRAGRRVATALGAAAAKSRLPPLRASGGRFVSVDRDRLCFELPSTGGQRDLGRAEFRVVPGAG